MDVKTKPFIVAMIEDISAINNLDEILNVRGLDAILIGPYDLSCSLKITGKFNHPRFKSALNKIISKTKKKNIILGLHILKRSMKEVKAHIKKGFKVIPYGTDAALLNHSISKSFQTK